jgi:methylmalonyl-CoA decarboxylase
VPLVLLDLQEGIGTLTFNNYQKRNALSRALLQELTAGLEDLVGQGARVVIIRAARGSQVWSAGFDISELPVPGRDALSYREALEQATQAIELCPAPVLAMIEGSVWGGACELASGCDLLIGAENASFAITTAKVATPYNAAGIRHFISMAGMAVVKEMLFTAQPISAERALKIGILNHLVTAAELETFTFTLARDISKNSPASLAIIKEQLRLLADAWHPVSREIQERIQELRRRLYESRDYLEGQRAFKEKRPPDFRGE